MKLRKIITASLVAVMCSTMVGINAHGQEVEKAVVALETNAVVDTTQITLNAEAVTNSAIVTNSTVVTEKGVEVSTLTEKPVQQKAATQQTSAETTDKDEVIEGRLITASKKTSVKKASKAAYSKSDLRLMSCIIFSEANMEPYAGKVGVGAVVVNRKNSKAFPNTIRGVIYQKHQFGPARNGSLRRALNRYDAGKFKSKKEKDCIKAAKAALEGVKTATYKGKKINMKKFLYFSTRVKGYKVQIAHHQFK